MFVDLDGLKPVNDTYGHEPATVLCGTARRLMSIVRSRHVARFGGDEFVVVFEPNDPSSHNLVSASMPRWPTRSMSRRPSSVVCPASIGVADTRAPLVPTPAALLAAADEAMYAVKRARANGAGP